MLKSNKIALIYSLRYFDCHDVFLLDYGKSTGTALLTIAHKTHSKFSFSRKNFNCWFLRIKWSADIRGVTKYWHKIGSCGHESQFWHHSCSRVTGSATGD